MLQTKMLNLRLFGGEGAGGTGAAGGESSGGEGAQSGVTSAVDAEQQKLLDLGVPAEKLRKRAKKSAGTAVQTAPAEPQTAPDAAVEQTDGNQTEAKRMTWDEIMADPEYNREMQNVVSQRLKKSRGAEEQMTKLQPVIELLTAKYGLDAENLNIDDLVTAVNNDDQYYEDRALEMGVSVETAKRIDQASREQARKEKEEQQTLEQQKIQQHIQKLEQQGEAMKKVFPSFDLKKELQNPAFARMTAPSVGISVEDAYYAVHRNEIQTRSMQATAQKTVQNISNSIQAGRNRPTENGVSGQAPSVTTFDYRNASREQREALKQRIRNAAARGEKLYPGG